MLVRGGKRQRLSGGSFRNLGRQPKVRELPKGDFVDPGIRVIDERPPIKQRQLSSMAEDLLEQYQRRVAFWWAVRALRTPVEWAGMIHLNVKKRRAYEILEEIGKYGAPQEWFEAKAWEGFQRGEIGPGRGTLTSGLADAFFIALAGGPDQLKELRDSFGARSRINLRDVLEGWRDLECEVIDYLVHSRLLWRE
jgi:hypothetical protein